MVVLKEYNDERRKLWKNIDFFKWVVLKKLIKFEEWQRRKWRLIGLSSLLLKEEEKFRGS